MRKNYSLSVVLQTIVIISGLFCSSFAWGQNTTKIADTALINKFKLQYNQTELKRGTQPSELEYLFSVSATIAAEPKEEFLKVGDKLVLMRDEQQRLREKGYMKMRNYVLFYNQGMLHLFNILPPQ